GGEVEREGTCTRQAYISGIDQAILVRVVLGSKGKLTMLCLALVVVATTVSCHKVPSAQEKRAKEAIAQRTPELQPLTEKRQSRERQLAAMTVSDLAKELRPDSDKESRPGGDPFNAMP